MTAPKYDPICSYADCGRPHNSHGLCVRHDEMRRKGIALRELQGRTGPLAKAPEERFFAKVEKSPSGCWLWTGGLTLGGYGNFALNTSHEGNSKIMAHRWAYEHLVGPIPPDFDIDHLCRVRNCVNPKHLEAVTRAENIRRAAAVKTECVNGHAFTPENTYTPAGTEHRKCVACRRLRDKARAPLRNIQRRARRAEQRKVA